MAARLCARARGADPPRLDPPSGGGWNPVYRWLADRVITSGEAIRRLVVEAGRAARARRRDPGRRGPRGLPVRRPRAGDARASWACRRPVIGSVAMFRGSKGHAHLLEAFATVRASGPSATLLLVGDGIRRHLGRGARARGGARGRGGLHRLPAGRAGAPRAPWTASSWRRRAPRACRSPCSRPSPPACRWWRARSAAFPRWSTDGETGLLVRERIAAALAAGHRARAGRPPRRRRRGRARRAPLVEERFSHTPRDRPAARALRRGHAGAPRAGRRERPAAHRPPPRRQSLVDGQRGAGDPPAPGSGRAGTASLLGLIAGDRFEAEGARGRDRALSTGSEPRRPRATRSHVAARSSRRAAAPRGAEGVDVVHAHHCHDHWLGWCGARAGRPRPDVPQRARGARSAGRPRALYRRTDARDRGEPPRSRSAAARAGIPAGALYRGRRRGGRSRASTTGGGGARKSARSSALGGAPVIGCVARLAAAPGPRGPDPRLRAALARVSRGAAPAGRQGGARGTRLEALVGELGLERRVLFAGYRDARPARRCSTRSTCSR